MDIQYVIRGTGPDDPVALTFDDGPNPPITEEVLDVLDAHDVPAAFFVIGHWVERWPRTVERMVERGHVVGNHSHRHQFNVCDYDEAEAAIGHVIGGSTTYARAHSFDYDSARLWPAADRHMFVDADVNPADYQKTDADEIVSAVLNDPLLGPGSIIDLHDSSELSDHSKRLARPRAMLEALPLLIQGLRDRGLRLGSLDEMTWGETFTWHDGDRDPQDPLGSIGPPRIGRRGA